MVAPRGRVVQRIFEKRRLASWSAACGYGPELRDPWSWLLLVLPQGITLRRRHSAWDCVMGEATCHPNVARHFCNSGISVGPSI